MNNIIIPYYKFFDENYFTTEQVCIVSEIYFANVFNKLFVKYNNHYVNHLDFNNISNSLVQPIFMLKFLIYILVKQDNILVMDLIKFYEITDKLNDHEKTFLTEITEQLVNDLNMYISDIGNVRDMYGTIDLNLSVYENKKHIEKIITTNYVTGNELLKTSTISTNDFVFDFITEKYSNSYANQALLRIYVILLRNNVYGSVKSYLNNTFKQFLKENLDIGVNLYETKINMSRTFKLLDYDFEKTVNVPNDYFNIVVKKGNYYVAMPSEKNKYEIILGRLLNWYSNTTHPLLVAFIMKYEDIITSPNFFLINKRGYTSYRRTLERSKFIYNTFDETLFDNLEGINTDVQLVILANKYVDKKYTNLLNSHFNSLLNNWIGI